MLYLISQRCEWTDIANAFLLSILFMYWLLRNKFMFYCLFLYWYWFPFFVYLYFLILGLMSTNLIRIPSYVYKTIFTFTSSKIFYVCPIMSRSVSDINDTVLIPFMWASVHFFFFFTFFYFRNFTIWHYWIVSWLYVPFTQLQAFASVITSRWCVVITIDKIRLIYNSREKAGCILEHACTFNYAHNK